jgi:MFS family permease
MNPAAISLISDHYPRSRVVGAVAIYSVGIVGGGGLAIILGGQLVAYLTGLGEIEIGTFKNVPAWRLVFIAMGIPGLIAALLVFFTVKDRKRSSGASSEVRPRPESTREVLAYFKANRRLYGLLYGGLIAFGFYNYSVLSWYPAMFGRTFGASPGQISIGYGVAYLVSGVIGALASAPAVRFFQHRGSIDGPVKVLLLTSAIALVPAIAGPLMPTFELTIAMFFVSMLMSAAQNSMAFTSFVMITPPHRRGVVVAAYVMTMNLTGGSFGGVIVGLLSDQVFGPEHLAHAIAAMAAISIPVSIVCFANLRTPYMAAAKIEEFRLEPIAPAGL